MAPITTGSLDKDSIKIQSRQFSALFEYSLPANGKSLAQNLETGVFIAKDSTYILDPKEGQNPIYRQAIYNEDTKKFQIDVIRLEPYTTYWFRIQVKHNDSISYTKIAGFTTRGFNLRWEPGFVPKVKLETLNYPDFILVGDSVDTNIENYQVMWGEMTRPLSKITKIEGINSYKLSFVINWSSPLDKKKLVVLYKGKSIFEDELEIEQPFVIDTKLTTELPGPIGDRAFFSFDNKLYAIALNQKNLLYIWDPSTNTWTSKPKPFRIEPYMGAEGVEINGKIYFPPITYADYYSNLPAWEDRIDSYDPLTDTWDTHTVYHTTSRNEETYPQGTFVYQNKLYCFVHEVRYPNGPGTAVEKRLLKVFDPADKSWATVMDIPYNWWGIDAIVLNNRIYVVQGEENSQWSATMDFKTVVYELNLAAKSFTKNAEAVFDGQVFGTHKPSVFAYNGNIYIHGGALRLGYYSMGSKDMLKYSPATNQMTYLQVLGARLPSENHFAFVFNGKPYIGLGNDAGGEYTNKIYELDLD